MDIMNDRDLKFTCGFPIEVFEKLEITLRMSSTDHA